MNYMNAKEAADKWGLSVRRVQVLCEQGRIDGVERLGNVWLMFTMKLGTHRGLERKSCCCIKLDQRLMQRVKSGQIYLCMTN